MSSDRDKTGGADSRTTGQRIRELREAKRWSQPELASRIGVAVQTVHRVEQGKSELPHRSNLYRYASALGTTVDYLLTGDMTADDAHREMGVEQFLRGHADLSNPDDVEYLVSTWRMLRALQRSREGTSTGNHGHTENTGHHQ